MRKFKVILLVLLTCGCIYCVRLIPQNAVAETSEFVESDYTLQYNEYVGYEDWMKFANCYSFALDIYCTDKEFCSVTKGSVSNYLRNPGVYSNKAYDDSLSVQNIASYTKSDLETLGCTDVAITTYMPTVTGNEHLICVRKTTAVNGSDYHFMKYNPDDGYWYHKPGNTSVLKYTGQMSVNYAWIGEYVDAYGYASLSYYDEEDPENDENNPEKVVTYNSAILFIKYTPFWSFDQNTGYFLVSDYGELKIMYNLPNMYYKLTSSISIPSSDPWAPIEHFTGILDGNGYSISNLRLMVNTTDNSDIGFIRRSTGAMIKNLTFGNVEIRINNSSVDFTQAINIGTIVGHATNGMISFCTVGSLRIYGEAHLSSNVFANIGGICGKNLGTITNCNVNYSGISGFGNLGAIAGQNDAISVILKGKIFNCSVNETNIDLYYGTAGGIAGYNLGEIEDDAVNGVTVSCYNGYPYIFPQYYPNDADNPHYAYVGGVSGWNDGGIIANVKVNACGVMYNGDPIDGNHIDGRSLAPEMGRITGQNKNGAQVSGTVDATTVNKGNLRVITWKGGFLNLVTYSHDQGQYAKNENIGRVV